MASVAWHFANQYQAEGNVKLFEGTDGYENGEQVRDFIYIDDVVSVNLYLMENPTISGIFNVGTGRAQSFNDVALSVINEKGRHQKMNPVSLQSAVASGVIRYIPLPAALEGKYQSFTEADLSRLRAAGYAAPFAGVEAGVGRYVEWLMAGSSAD